MTDRQAIDAAEPGAGLGRESELGRALEIVGPRWALLVVQALQDGPCRFKDLTERLPGVSTNLLVERLRGLEQAGVISRGVGVAPRSVVTYELTDLGRALDPAIEELRRWSEHLPG
ncbi:winged helix-turn-helix transcriptional regulator [Flindersiella endophytica]